MLPRNLLWLAFLLEQFQKDPSVAASSSRHCGQCPCAASDKFHTRSWDLGSRYYTQVPSEINSFIEPVKTHAWAQIALTHRCIHNDGTQILPV